MMDAQEGKFTELMSIALTMDLSRNGNIPTQKNNKDAHYSTQVQLRQSPTQESKLIHLAL